MKNENVKILVVDDEAAICEVLSASLADENYQVQVAKDADEALSLYNKFMPDIVLLDVWMPGGKDGIDVLKEIKSKPKSAQVIMMSGHGTIETAVGAVKMGAYDFVEKPLSMDRIGILIRNILDLEQERKDKENLLSQIQASLRLVGTSEESRRIRQMVTKISGADNWGLVKGEKGVGKLTVAKNIHYLSSRASGPFIHFQCTSIPEDLLEGELFGYAKGSKPGLEEDKKGVFEYAHKGTLYIENAESLTLGVQEKLMEALKSFKATRFGGVEAYDADVRVLISAPSDIEGKVKSGQFREDLYYRLNVVPLEIKPLRERAVDIPILVDHFVDEICRKTGVKAKTLRPEAVEALKKYDWPGNVRELQNFIERLYILFDQNIEVGVEDLTYAGLKLQGEAGVIYKSYGTFREARAQFEKEFLLAKIEENNGNISKTSEAIGLERSYLHRKIKAYGIEVN